VSDTYKDKRFGYFHALVEKERPFHTWGSAYYSAHKKYEINPKYGTLYHPHFYCTSPSWWTREMMNRPARHETQRLLNEITIDNCEEELNFPNWKSPYIYYY
jgi:hypothetical protein